jgi:hypothetical protein
MTFQTREMIENFDQFWDSLPNYAPRDYVQENIGLSAGAARFLELFRNVA